MFEHKQVMVVRTDLNMTSGKVAVQVAHGSLSAAEEAREKHREWHKAWKSEGQKKVVVKVDSEGKLLELKGKAEELGLPSALISDAGLTELSPGTSTVLGLGPAPNDDVDKVTGDLPLYGEE